MLIPNPEAYLPSKQKVVRRGRKDRIVSYGILVDELCLDATTLT
eukprot:COSAG02_NODE_70455_length_195_cov_195.197917_1_plen_43_part_10